MFCCAEIYQQIADSTSNDPQDWEGIIRAFFDCFDTAEGFVVLTINETVLFRNKTGYSISFKVSLDLEYPLSMILSLNGDFVDAERYKLPN